MTVCYFTASGNCLYVARRIGGTLLSIPQLMRQEKIEIEDDAVGIVCPVYAVELPFMIVDFMKRAEIKTDYFFFIVRVDRSRCGYRFDIVHVREFPVYSRHGCIKLRVVMDKHSLELFVNDGEQAASFVMYTPVNADVISFEAEGEVLMDVDKHDLIFDKEEEEQ